MNEEQAPERSFPQSEIMTLLGKAQQLFETVEAREQLLTSLGLSQSAIQPRQRETGLGEPPGEMSPRVFASNLVSYLDSDAKFDIAMTLVRRVSAELGLTASEQVTDILDLLEALQLDYRTRSLESGESPDLETYRQWAGFVCLHTYSLTDRFYGRVQQLADLDQWVTQAEESASVYCICALGGGGKTALAWYWISRSQPMIRQQGYRGIFWCSFYEKGFDFTQFLKQALIFCSQTTEENIANLTRAELERRLLNVLSEERYLLVIDGLERLMNGYATVFDRAVDAESMQGAKQEDQVTAYDRRLTDPRSGSFLRRLADKIASKILITTRLEPAELQGSASDKPLPYVDFMFLEGLDPESAHELWKSIMPDASISQDLQAIFLLSGYHPLVISILARSVASKGGDWETWRELPAHRDFAPRKENLPTEVRAHIIGICILDLDPLAHDVLSVLTTSGKPMAFEIIARLLIRGSAANGDERWQSEEQVTRVLQDLIELGFIGSAQQEDFIEYDVHPVVRGAAWNLLTDPARERFLSHALSEFYATPDRYTPEGGLDALNRATSYFKILAQTSEYDRAWEMYYHKLWPPLMAQNANRELLDLFELLLPERDVFQLVPLKTRNGQGNAASVLGNLLMTAGDVSRSDRLLRWCGAIRLQLGDANGFLNARHERTWQTMYQGRLFETELDLRTMKIDAVQFNAAEIIPSLDCWIGIVLALRGEQERARRYFDSAKGQTYSFRWWAQGLAEGYVYLDEPDSALKWISEAEKSPLVDTDNRMQIAWERLTRGMAFFKKCDFEGALDELSFVLEEALRANYMVIQRFAIPYIAEIYLEQGKLDEAEARVEDYFRIDPNSEYQLSATDAWRVRALCCQARGKLDDAQRYASKAYRLAACDGPPFVYKKGLERARSALEKCGAYVPRATSRLDPMWQRSIAELPDLAPATDEDSEPAADDDATRDTVIILTIEKAREILEQTAVMRQGSKKDRKWWEEVTRHTHSMIKLPFAKAMEARDIQLEDFRRAYEESEHKSLEVVFHQLYAEKIVYPDKPLPIRALDRSAKGEWLTKVAEHQTSLDQFLDTDLAKNAAVPFLMHEFGKIGVSAFLADDKRRIRYSDDPDAKQWWDQLEHVSPPLSMLVLAESILLTGNTMQGLFDSIAVGTKKGLEYGFAATLVDRAIERLQDTTLSRTEGWSDVQIFLRLEDVKQKLGWSTTTEDVRSFWRSIENKNQTDIAKVLQLAEELSLRGATLDDYYQAYLSSSSDNIQANLAYIDYLRLKDERWELEITWPEDDRSSLAITGALSPTFTNAAEWSDKRIENRLHALQEKLKEDEAPDKGKDWWSGLAKTMQPTTILRLAEELDVRKSSIAEIYLAHVDGSTDNPRAALMYLDFTLLKKIDERRATSDADRHNTIGNEQYRAGNYAEAIKSYQAAIDAAPKPGSRWFYSNLALAWQKMPDVDTPERFAKALAALRQGIENGVTSEEFNREVDSLELRTRLFDRLGYPRKDMMMPVVTPIAMEVAADLIPLVEDSDNSDPNSFMKRIEKIRDRVLEETGVKYPGVRIRGNETDLPDGTYIFMLDEIPIVSGKVSLDQCLTRVSYEELAQQGIKYEEAIDPLDGGEIAWISTDDMEKLDETRPAEDYMLRHFQSLITKNLSLFSGHQEIHDRLEADWSESAQAIAADPDKITLLTRLVRALLDEQVPTRHFSVICDELEKTREVKLGLDDLLALVRMLPEIRATLPANDPQVRLLKLSDEIETAIKDSITKEGDEHVLELEPEITQEILTAVRNEVGNLEASLPIALLVGEGPVRRYTRKLMELEFPQLSVVSEEEFLEPWDERFVATAILK